MRHLLLTELWLPHIGGSIRLFHELYCKQFPPDEPLHVVAGAASGDAQSDALSAHQVTRFDPTRYIWMRPESLASYARMWSATARVALRDRTEVVHCARVIPEGLIGLTLKHTMGIPYVVWVHGEEVSMYLRYRGKRALMPKILSEARAVICNSTFSQMQANTAGAPPDRLHVVNPCVDAARFAGPFDTAELRRRLRLGGKSVLLTVGRMTRRKGHDYVLKALARLRRRDVVYVILSDGELETELQCLAQDLGIKDLVRFVGPVPQVELPQYYALCDVFVMANRVLSSGDVEGFGMVFLEASASGRAIIGGRSGGVVDAVLHGETGLLVDGSSVDEIARALQTLLDDRALRDRLGANGREWVQKKFSWDRASRRVREVALGRIDPFVRPERSVSSTVMVGSASQFNDVRALVHSLPRP